MVDPLVSAVARTFHQALGMTGLSVMDSQLIVGVSGGPDSLALLDILARLYPPGRLIVAHLDHGLRPSSAEEATLVALAAEERGLRAIIERAEGIDLAGSGLSLEAAGRAARYSFFARIAHDEGAKLVTVGHNANDQIETVLMHLLRGTGPSGLRGMSIAGPLPGQSEMWLLRPLLGISRAEIEAYCRKIGLAPSIDESNADTTFRRNRIRHELLPLLETYNPQIRRRLLETASILAAEDDFLTDLEETAWTGTLSESTPDRIVLSRKRWQAQPLAMRRRLLQRAMTTLQPENPDVSFRSIEGARRIAEGVASGKQKELSDGLLLSIGYESIELSRGDRGAGHKWPALWTDSPMPLPVPGELQLGNGWVLVSEAKGSFDYDGVVDNPDPWRAWVNVSPETDIFVRPRKQGERVRPLGLGSETSVKEVMINRKIPAAARALWPIVATADHPLWLVGHILDERARVHPGSSHAVYLRCFRRADVTAESLG